jgi:hypothetical protein
VGINMLEEKIIKTESLMSVTVTFFTSFAVKLFPPFSSSILSIGGPVNMKTKHFKGNILMTCK